MVQLDKQHPVDHWSDLEYEGASRIASRLVDRRCQELSFSWSHRGFCSIYECLPLRKFVLSLHNDIHWPHPLCVHTTPLVSMDRHNVSTSRPPKQSHARYPPSWNAPLTSIHRGFCTITSLISLLPYRGWFDGLQRFSHSPKLCAHCISLYTRDLDAAGYDPVWDWAWLVI